MPGGWHGRVVSMQRSNGQAAPAGARLMRAADLPLRDGVGASCVALPAGPWATVIDFLASRFPAIGRPEWEARMQRGDVIDARGDAVAPQSPYRAHGQIFYYRNLAVETPIPFEETILFQDDWLVVADKPHFLPVTPSGGYLQQTLLVRLKRRLGIDTLAPMHRIDRDTAGIVLFTVQPHTRNRYQALFRDRAVAKIYEAIAPWRAELALPLVYRSQLVQSGAFMQMQERAGVPNAETAVELMEVRGRFARYRLRPATGQKHQLRAHMAALDIPIVNDRIYPHLYPAEIAATAPDYSRPLQLLAQSLAFTDPYSGQQRQFHSRLRLQFDI